MAAGDALQLSANRTGLSLQLPVFRPLGLNCQRQKPRLAATGASNRSLSMRPFHARYFATTSLTFAGHAAQTDPTARTRRLRHISESATVRRQCYRLAPPPERALRTGSRSADQGRWLSCASIAHCSVSRTWPRCSAIAASHASRIVSCNRGNDRLVLAEGLLGPARPEHRAVLEPNALRFQRHENLDRHLVVGDPPDSTVQVPVELAVPERIGLAQALGHRAHDCSKVGEVGIGRTAGGAAGQQPFERVAHLLDLQGFAGRDQPDPGAAVRFPDDETLLIQDGESGADGRPAHPQSNREIRLDEPFVRLKLTADNRLTEPVTGVGDGSSSRAFGRGTVG